MLIDMVRKGQDRAIVLIDGVQAGWLEKGRTSAIWSGVVAGRKVRAASLGDAMVLVRAALLPKAAS